MDMAIIPAYNPDGMLLRLVQELRVQGIYNIIVVNDGSEDKTLTIFRELEGKAIILTHKINKGKGAAIKTALRYIDINNLNVRGIVLLDADGQHLPEDAARLLKEVKRREQGLILGVRQLKDSTSLKSLIGNTVTKYVFRLISGRWLSDTQTGLRAFKKSMIPVLLKINGERYEYEMNMLLTCVKKGIDITEIPVGATKVYSI